MTTFASVLLSWLTNCLYGVFCGVYVDVSGFAITGGYSGQSFTYGVTLGGTAGSPAMSVHSPTTCTVTSPGTPSCSIKISSGGAATNQSITYTPQGGAVTPTPSSSGSFNVLPHWTQISGGTSQIPNTYLGGTWVTNVNNIVAVDSTNNSYNTWIWNGTNWTQITGLNPSQPDSGGSGEPTGANISTAGFLFQDWNNSILWKWKDNAWTKIIASNFSGNVSANSDTDVIYASTGGYGNAQYQHSSNGGSSWTNLTSGAGQPASSLLQYFINPVSSTSLIVVQASDSKIFTSVNNGVDYSDISSGQPPLNNSNWRIYNGSTAASIIVNGAATNSPIGDLYTYNGAAWTQLTGGGGQPSQVSSVCNTTDSGTNTDLNYNHIVMMDAQNPAQYWTYVGSAWTQITGGGGQPSTTGLSQCDGFVGTPITSSIYLVDNAKKMWYYNGTSWTSMSGGGGQPSQVTSSAPVGNPPYSTIYVTDSTNQLWKLSSGTWSKITTGGVNQPSAANFIGAIPTATTELIKDSNNYIWKYSNGTWTQLTSGQSGEPADLSVVNYYSSNSVVGVDGSGNIWINN